MYALLTSGVLELQSSILTPWGRVWHSNWVNHFKDWSYSYNIPIYLASYVHAYTT